MFEWIMQQRDRKREAERTKATFIQEERDAVSGTLMRGRIV